MMNTEFFINSTESFIEKVGLFSVFLLFLISFSFSFVLDENLSFSYSQIYEGDRFLESVFLKTTSHSNGLRSMENIKNRNNFISGFSFLISMSEEDDLNDSNEDKETSEEEGDDEEDKESKESNGEEYEKENNENEIEDLEEDEETNEKDEEIDEEEYEEERDISSEESGDNGGGSILGGSNGEVEIKNVEINKNEDIFPVEGTSFEVELSAEVLVSGGWGNLEEDSLTAVFYREGVGKDCLADKNNCYNIDDFDIKNCSGNSCDISGSFSLWYIAEPTDEGEYEEEGWISKVSALDINGNEGVGFSDPVDVLTLSAIYVLEEEIDFGEMERNTDTGDVNKVTTIRNTGNSTVGLDIYGEEMTQNGNAILPSYQRWNTEPFVYSTGGNELELESINTGLEIEKAVSIEHNKEGTLYWGLRLPDEPLPTGVYTGRNNFIAVPSN